MLSVRYYDDNHMRKVGIAPLSILLLLAIGISVIQFTKNPLSQETKKASVSVAKKVATPSAITIVAAGDVSCGGAETTSAVQCQQAATADLIKKLNPDAVLALGDLQYDGATSDLFSRFYDKAWGAFKNKTYPVVGNHEYEDPQAVGYFTYFGTRAGEKEKGYYSFDLGSWHVVALNSNCWAVDGCDKNSPQYQWLAADLAKSPAKCTLAFWHHPLFTGGEHDGLPDVREMWQLLQDKHADVILTGHDHLYERFGKLTADGKADPTGIRSFVVGTGGRNLYALQKHLLGLEIFNDQTFGVLQMTLKEDSYIWKFVPITGSTFTDSGEEKCNP